MTLISLTPQRGQVLLFAHGFNIRFDRSNRPRTSTSPMIAPKGPGHLVRRTYLEGGGVPALVAVEHDATGHAHDLALAYANALGATPPGFSRPRSPKRPRRISSASRSYSVRGDGPRARGLRDARRSGVPARERVLRVPARTQAHRGLDVRRGHHRDAIQRVGHRRVRRPDPGPR